MVKTDPVENSNPCVTCFQNYLLPQRFFTLSIYLICKKVKKKTDFVSLICYVISVQCITVCLSYKQYEKKVVGVLTVNRWDKVLYGSAVQWESSRPLSFLIFLNGLKNQLFLKGNIGAGITDCLCMHLHPHNNTWGCDVLIKQLSFSTFFHSYSLTAFPRLSALGMCSKSTKGWAKNSLKVIRTSGFLSSSRSRRSLQSLETLAPGGSSRTKHNFIKLNSIQRTFQRKGTATFLSYWRPSLVTPLALVKRWP